MFRNSKVKLFAFFYAACIYSSCYGYPSPLTEKGDRLKSENLFDLAIPNYLKTLYHPLFYSEDVKLKLAECYLKNDAPQKCLSLLANHKNESLHETYLTAVAYRQLGNFQQALSKLQNIQKDKLFNLIYLEIGLNQLALLQTNETEKTFNQIQFDLTHPQLYYYANYYLTLCHLLKADSLSAHQTFNRLPTHYPSEDSSNYLLALAYMLESNYPQAIDLLEKILNSNSSKSTRHLALRSLIDAHLEMAQLNRSSNSIDKATSYNEQFNDLFFSVKIELFKWKINQDIEAHKKGLTLLKTCQINQKTKLIELEFQPNTAQQIEFYTNFSRENRDNNQFLHELNCRFGDILLEKSAYKNAFKCYQKALKLSLKTENLFQTSHVINKFIKLASLHPAHECIHYLIGCENNHPNIFSQKQIELVCELLCQHLDAIQSLPISFISKAHSYFPHNSRISICQSRIAITMGNYKKAETVLSTVKEKDPLFPDALFWKAQILENLQNVKEKQQKLYEIYTNFPKHPVAALSYLHYYTPQDYLLGNKNAIKHLKKMPSYFQQSTALMDAYFILGLNYKQENFSNAIQSFQKVEQMYEMLKKENKIPLNQKSYYLQKCNQAKFERANANFSIGKSSPGAKKQIYLNYAADVFAELINELAHNHPLILECLYWRAKVHKEIGDIAKTQNDLDQALQLCDYLKLKSGYLLSRIWYEKGILAKSEQNTSAALEYLEKAEKTGLVPKKVLSADQKLDLWIQMSECYKSQGDLEKAMTLLSQAVNDESISGLRIKSMLARADIYILQGRYELALKQLEAVCLKGGEWSQEAKLKIVELNIK